MAVRIRLKRVGAIHAPKYRVAVVDSRKKRDGRVIEEIGIYDPIPNPSIIKIDSDRAVYWLGVGAQPSKAVRRLLKLTGDLARHAGKEDVVSYVQVAEVDKDAVAKEAVAAAEDTAMKDRAKLSEKQAKEAKEQEAKVEEADKKVEETVAAAEADAASDSASGADAE